MTLRAYKDLGTVYRGDPCKEYPGTWLVYVKGEEVYGSQSQEDAYWFAAGKVMEYDLVEQSEPLRVSICWQCSDDDPRVGQIWFTGFYQHGKFNQFGEYKT